MNWLDITFVLLAALSLAAGLSNGFYRTGVGMPALLFGAILGWSMYPDNLVGCCVVLGVVLVVAGLAAKAAGKQLQEPDLRWLDRALGGVAGFANGALLWAACLVGLLLFTPLLPPRQVARSQAASYTLEAVAALMETVPDEARGTAHRRYEELRKRMPPGHRLQKAPQWPATEI